ncbi:ABC transporter ATP-binding protein [Haloimpatiens sp. FM7330]|uniref:ABC transporter ATP-binding protein n=1 Tax=Haloimpatiens sp. FM7330 TaxID=3298610 RepID=UPI0036415F61
MNVLEVKDIYKRIGKKEIIKGVNLSVKAGEIFGFLGPNGAGKTTTIRMLVGLIAPNKGTIKIMGKDVQKQRNEALRNVGCIVENPDMYNDFTGMQNLRFYADMYGDISQKRIDEVVELIGLSERINDKVKKYSLGMKQRLGLGQAILAKPKLLILDEPTNGLDPIGMHDFKEIIKRAAKENNSAVFISSHILAEIEQVCTSFAVIDKGVIQAVESVSTKACDIEKLKIYSGECDKLVKLFSTLDFINNIDFDENCLMINIKSGNFSKVIKEIGKNDINIDDIYKIQDSLEDKFIKILEGEN